MREISEKDILKKLYKTTHEIQTKLLSILTKIISNLSKCNF